MDPNLKKIKFTISENKKLFELHKKLGSKWKEIANHFLGRTDNCIKNNFFSLIRKSLRDASKFLGNSGNSFVINQIRPKILADFLKIDLEIFFSEKIFLEFGIFKENVNMSELVEKFCFFKNEKILNEKDFFVIKKSLDFLKNLNYEYLELKKKKIKKGFFNKNLKKKNLGKKKFFEKNEIFEKFKFINNERNFLEGNNKEFENNFLLQKKKKKIL